MGIKVKISHVPGHVNLMPNEIADREAKKAAEKAKNIDNQEVDIQLIKQVVRKVTTKKWEKYWYNTSSHTTRYQLNKRVYRKSFKSIGGKKYTANWIKLVSGHNRLADNMFRMKLNESPDCECKEDRETVEHVIMNCKRFDKERDSMMNRIETIYVKNDVRKDRRGLSLNKILYPEIGGTAASQIRKAVLDFICEVKIKL